MSLAAIFAWIGAYKYVVIFFSTLLEGPVVMMLAGIMLRLGQVTLLPVFIVLVVGDLSGDIFWYFIGYYFAHPIAEKYGKYIGLTPEILEKTREKFRNHQGKILFISKITMGFGLALAVLVTAGMSKMSFKKYLAINMSGELVWTGFLLTLGYFFGNLFAKLSKDLQVVSLVGFIIILFFLLKGINSYLQTKNLKADI